jgi:hypothetical protein
LTFVAFCVTLYIKRKVKEARHGTLPKNRQ